MDRPPRIRRFLRLRSSGSAVTDIDEEIAFHLRERVAELIAAGATPLDAQQQAERQFGDLAEARAELTAIDRSTLRRELRAQSCDAALSDVRFALRGLRRNPAFSLAVVVTLALGIGVNAAMFGITDRLLLSPPAHVVDAENVARVLYQFTPSWSGVLTTTPILPYADYVALRERVPAFSDIAAYSFSSYSVLGRGEGAIELRIVFATASLFPTLGVAPALGRFFTDAEDALPRGERVLVLSHAFWQGRFGGDPGVIGRKVDIDNMSYQIIGVAPRGFTGFEFQPVHAWAPVSAVGPDRGGDHWHSTRNMYWLSAVARLAPGTGAELAREQASAAFVAANAERFSSDTTAGIVLGSVIAARAPAVGIATEHRSGRIALWLLGVSLLVLVISCANVANLFLARGLRRRRDIGVRMALGVSRMRLARQVLTETTVVALVGGALGLLLAHWGGQFTRSLLLPNVEWAGSPIDHRVLFFAGIAACASALLAGLIPAFHSTRADVVTLLRLGDRGTYRRSPLQSGLVALQAMLSVVLLVGAGLFVRSLHQASSVPLGFDPDRVATFAWHSNGLDWDRARVHALYQAGLERVQTLPEVQAAALGTSEPMSSARYATIRVPGRDSVPVPPGEGLHFTPVSTDYFRTVGARIVRGRPFTDGDVAGSSPVSIVTESLAHLLWPGEDALGKCFVHVDEDEVVCREVVGVVENTHYSTVEGEPTAMIFSPMAQAPGGTWRTLFVRLNGDPATSIGAVRRALVQLEPGLPHVQAQLLRTRVDPQLQPWRLGATLFSAFGALALLLASLGLYGVIAYDVAQRRRELGVRVAFGARARNLVGMVLRDAMRVIVLGLLAGLAIAGWAAPRIEPLLFDVSAGDPIVLATVSMLLFAIGLAAATLPARRAARVQPIEALRDE